jgi:hypothetical protein
MSTAFGGFAGWGAGLDSRVEGHPKKDRKSVDPNSQYRTPISHLLKEYSRAKAQDPVSSEPLGHLDVGPWASKPKNHSIIRSMITGYWILLSIL